MCYTTRLLVFLCSLADVQALQAPPFKVTLISTIHQEDDCRRAILENKIANMAAMSYAHGIAMGEDIGGRDKIHHPKCSWMLKLESRHNYYSLVI